MSVNGITSTGSAADAYTAHQTTAAKSTETPASDTTTIKETGVVYEKSSTDTAKKAAAKTYTPNTELVAKLKADAQSRIDQMQSLVEKLISKQGNSYGLATDMWQFLASGNYTVDAATKEQAQKDIADDGYWGVDQTSDRILDFAKALSGGDPDKMTEMKEAFQKGFKQATGAWGKDLPDISQNTYDAVMKKFDDWASTSGKQEESN